MFDRYVFPSKANSLPFAVFPRVMIIDFVHFRIIRQYEMTKGGQLLKVNDQFMRYI